MTLAFEHTFDFPDVNVWANTFKKYFVWQVLKSAGNIERRHGSFSSYVPFLSWPFVVTQRSDNQETATFSWTGGGWGKCSQSKSLICHHFWRATWLVIVLWAATKTLRLLAVYCGLCCPSIQGLEKLHYRDPYQPTSIVECNKGLERCSSAPTSYEIDALHYSNEQHFENVEWFFGKYHQNGGVFIATWYLIGVVYWLQIMDCKSW